MIFCTDSEGDEKKGTPKKESQNETEIERLQTSKTGIHCI